MKCIKKIRPQQPGSAASGVNYWHLRVFLSFLHTYFKPRSKRTAAAARRAPPAAQQLPLCLRTPRRTPRPVRRPAVTALQTHRRQSTCAGPPVQTARTHSRADGPVKRHLCNPALHPLPHPRKTPAHCKTRPCQSICAKPPAQACPRPEAALPPRCPPRPPPFLGTAPAPSASVASPGAASASPRAEPLPSPPSKRSKIEWDEPEAAHRRKAPLLGGRWPDGPASSFPLTLAAGTGQQTLERGAQQQRQETRPSGSWRTGAAGPAAGAPRPHPAAPQRMGRRLPPGGVRSGRLRTGRGGRTAQLASAPLLLQPPTRLGTREAGMGEAAPRRRGDALDGADPPLPPPSRAGAGACRTSGHPEAQRGPHLKWLPCEKPTPRPALPAGESGRQRCPRQASVELRGARWAWTGSFCAPGSRHLSRSQNSTRLRPEPGKARFHRAHTPEGKARPRPGKHKCQKLRNADNRKMICRRILLQVTIREQLRIQRWQLVSQKFSEVFYSSEP